MKLSRFIGLDESRPFPSRVFRLLMKSSERINTTGKIHCRVGRIFANCRSESKVEKTLEESY